MGLMPEKDNDGHFIGPKHPPPLVSGVRYLLMAFSHLSRRPELALLRRVFSSEEPVPTWLENAV
jgi:hypothetical protein